MSFVQEHIKNIQHHLDGLLLDSSSAATAQDEETRALIERAGALHSSGRRLAPAYHRTSSTAAAQNVIKVLQESRLSDGLPSDIERPVQWSLVGEAAVQTFALTLQHLILQTHSLSAELSYWNDLADSSRYTVLYGIQTSPFRFWNRCSIMYQNLNVENTGKALESGWRTFYGIAEKAVRDMILDSHRMPVARPFASLKAEIRVNIKQLDHAKSHCSSAIGFLLYNCFSSQSLGNECGIEAAQGFHMYREIVVKSVSAMNLVLDIAMGSCDADHSFDTTAKSRVNNDMAWQYDHDDCFGKLRYVAGAEWSPRYASQVLQNLLSRSLPLSENLYNHTLVRHSRPSAIVRLWLPGTALLISSSTILQVVLSRRAAILNSIRELGATTIDFWENWVLEPTRRLIGTIRHDEKSQVSIMSEKSLEGDQASLERMVIDFAVDNPDGPLLDDTQIADVKANVQEGDLTPVLKAYEKDLQSPIYGSLRGNLVRALLIQIQKTKVDVEVAMGGIDSLLKSQELVFGFVGLTPGILVCVGVFQWLRGVFGSRRASLLSQEQNQSARVFCNIDRLLTASQKSNAQILGSENYGMLVCEAIDLRGLAANRMSKPAYREFVTDFNDLIGVDTTISQRMRIADRIRWAYSKQL